jgi:hypothetical protein
MNPMHDRILHRLNEVKQAQAENALPVMNFCRPMLNDAVLA